MRFRAAPVAATLLLIACDQPGPTAPTRPTPDVLPAFQVGQDQVNVALSRNAEWNSEFQITVSGSFHCPESQTAFFSVQVIQAKSNGTVAQGFGSSNEACKFGSNKWRVTVFGSFSGWDLGPAVATVIMSTPSGADSDQGEIHIR